MKYGVLPEHLAEARTGRRQRHDRGDHLPVHRLRHRRRRRVDAAGERRRGGQRNRRRAVAGRPGRRLVHAERSPPPIPRCACRPTCSPRPRACCATPPSIRPIWLSVLGLSWFWTMGATLLTEFPVVARDTLHSGGSVLTLLLTVFAIGVGIGSIQCARLLHGEVSARLVPFAALGISLFCWDFASAATAAGAAGGFATAAAALQVVRRLAHDGRSVPAGGVRRHASRCRSTPSSRTAPRRPSAPAWSPPTTS